MKTNTLEVQVLLNTAKELCLLDKKVINEVQIELKVIKKGVNHIKRDWYRKQMPTP